jgi:hypothetical protein
MSLLTTIVACLAVMALAELVVGAFRWRRQRQLRVQVRAERTRGKFSELRYRLVKEVQEGRLDSRSMTFQALYIVHTQVMRRPDEYDVVASELHAAFSSRRRSPAGDAIEAEAEEWSAELRAIAEETSQGLLQIVFDHNRMWGAVISFEQRTGAVSASLGFVATCMRALAKVLRKLAEDTEDEPTTQIRHVSTLIGGDSQRAFC